MFVKEKQQKKTFKLYFLQNNSYIYKSITVFFIYL